MPAKISDVKITNVVTSGLTDPWNGSLTNIKFTTDTTTATADVTVQNTSNGTLGLNLLTNPSLASPVNGILVVSIPDNPGSTQIYAVGQASTQTFNFEIDTVQNP